MYTSCFGRLKLIPPGLRPVGVSIGIPSWFRGDRELRLAPTRQMLKMGQTEYDTLYNRTLLSLSPEMLYKSLGENAVLLCWEKPGEGCHRRAAAEWMEHHLGVVIPELGYDRLETEWQTSATYKHWKTPDVCKRLMAERLPEARGVPGECCDANGEVHQATKIGTNAEGWPIFQPVEGTFPLFHVASEGGNWAAVLGPRDPAKKKKPVRGKAAAAPTMQEALFNLDDFLSFG